MQLTAKRYDTATVCRVTIEAGEISQVETIAHDSGDAESLPWIAPGFIDIQVNGYGGQEFSSAEITVEQVRTVVRRLDEFGVVGVCPTLTTNGFEALSHGVRTIAAACDEHHDVQARVVGIHVEGPYICREDGPRGAHPLEHCQPPDWEHFSRLQDAAEGHIVLLTLSPEYDAAPAFIARAVRSGVTVALGHMSATSDQIRAAVDAGASLSTHLGNGAHGQLRRHPNYIWDQLAEDRLSASLIVDGHHLPREVVQSFVRGKTPQRCILVSDFSGLAGLPVGRYDSSGCELEILADGRLVIAGQRQLLAGASAPIGRGIANVIAFAGVDLRTAVDMAGQHPLRLLGRTPGQLRPGDAANLTLFDYPADTPDGLNVRATIIAGDVVYGAV
ncbi:MAG: amidohydrolase family protein [Planctomycetales bacterium]|nr:amidohydrolase family protein [Planctomycetales bacterium]